MTDCTTSTAMPVRAAALYRDWRALQLRADLAAINLDDAKIDAVLRSFGERQHALEREMLGAEVLDFEDLLALYDMGVAIAAEGHTVDELDRRILERFRRELVRYGDSRLGRMLHVAPAGTSFP